MDDIQSLAIAKNGGPLAWVVVPSEGHPMLYLEDGKHWPLPVTRDPHRASPPAPQPVIATRIVFSTAGDRFMAAATGQDSVVLVEGEIQRHPWLSLESLKLSDDGSRSAYVVYRPDEEAVSGMARRHVAELWVDGRRTGTQALAWMRGVRAGGPAAVVLGGITSICFSPGGGQHVACLRLAAAQSGEGGVREVWINDAVAPVPHQDAAQVAWLNSEDVVFLDMRPGDSSIWHVIHRIPIGSKR